jgi:AraC-like DNA-binding protein
MKVLPFTIPKSKHDSILLQEDKGAVFYDLLHQHEEIQLSYIVKGEGTLIVGDTINFYKSGDVLVLGENLPHVFRSDSKKNTPSQMRTVFFTKDAFGINFFKIEELKSLQSFFNKAANGFRLISKEGEIIKLFDAIFSAKKLDRFILFLQLLKKVNRAKYEHLSTFVSEKKYSDNEGKRMSNVFAYTINHFHLEISLDAIAREAAMTKTAFCKYFKKRTNKTYITFLNEFRIEEACKLLQREKEWSIPEVAERSGFHNISHFNRKFKLLKGKTPSEYRKELAL